MHCHFKLPSSLHQLREDQHRYPQANHQNKFCSVIVMEKDVAHGRIYISLECIDFSASIRKNIVSNRAGAVAVRSVPVSSDLRTSCGCTRCPHHPQAPPWSPARISHAVPPVSTSQQLRYSKDVSDLVLETHKGTYEKEHLRCGLFHGNASYWVTQEHAYRRHVSIPGSDGQNFSWCMYEPQLCSLQLK